ncbi:MAG: hypothetical protein ACTSRU_19485 [Candidatus Hodarchaeales archaeon]|jgi:hypothetical protein
MKQLISATLSEEAAKIYNDWEKQKKSQIISDMIINQDVNLKLIEALRIRRDVQTALIAKANVALWLKDPKDPLCKELNESLVGTIHYQYRN